MLTRTYWGMQVYVQIRKKRKEGGKVREKKKKKERGKEKQEEKERDLRLPRKLLRAGNGAFPSFPLLRALAWSDLGLRASRPPAEEERKEESSPIQALRCWNEKLTGQTQLYIHLPPVFEE